MQSKAALARPFVRFLLFAVAFCALPSIGGWACDTPVYRYAMYRWQPSPHEVYYFHEGEIAPQDTKVHDLLRQAGQDRKAPANLALLTVDISEGNKLDTIPQDVKQAFLARKDPSLPAYMTFTPQGVPTFTGKLQEADASAMLKSPARDKLAQLLKEGCICVFVLLTNDDEASNQKSKEVLEQLAKDVEAGKVKLYGGPADKFPEQKEPADDKEETPDGEKKDAEKSPPQKIGVLKVSRDDKQEQWFVRALLAVRDRNEFDDDLHDYNEPMAFPVYGRARALPPYIGKGITRDNMLDVVEFVSGACSCTVKEQNPGVDLPVTYNWEDAAAALAAIHGSEEGNEKQFAAEDLFPDLIIPDAQQIGEPVADKPKTDQGDPQTQQTDPTQPTSTDPVNTDPVGNGDPEATNTDPVATSDQNADPPANNNDAGKANKAKQDDTKDRKTASNAPLPAGDGEKPRTSLSIWTVAIGIAIGLLGLFLATFLIIRPR